MSFESQDEGKGFGLHGHSTDHDGVRGSTDSGLGLAGHADTGTGVWARSNTGPGIYGECTGAGEGIRGQSMGGDAITGFSHGPTNSGVYGKNDLPDGNGVTGDSSAGRGVMGRADTGTGVQGSSAKNDGVSGFASVAGRSGVFGNNNIAGGNGVAGISVNGNGIFGQSQSGSAGHFDGNVTVTGDIRLTGADCAENFDVSQAEGIEPGSVMVIGQEGTLKRSERPYDKRVAGVVSGAGDYKAGIILDNQDVRENRRQRMPVALVGKVACKADAQYAPIEVGDLLTTSSTPGHAMKATDPARAFGTVIGKSLQRLTEGQGLVHVLVCLQ